MGTRSSYSVIEKSGDTKKVLCNIYCQYDGYPTGHPLDTAKFLSGRKVVNGFASNDTKVFNGAGCLAARLIGFLKEDKIGNVYIQDVESRGNCGEEYLYDIIVDEDKRQVQIVATNDSGEEFFSGSPSQYLSRYGS